MKFFFFSLLFLGLICNSACNNDIQNKSPKINIDSLHQVLKTKPSAKNYDNEAYSILIETKGDLDKDKIDERIVIYKSKDDYMYYLVVYKFVDNEWYVWFKNDKKSFTAVKTFEVKEHELIFTFTGPHSVVTDHYTLKGNDFLLSKVRLDYSFNCSIAKFYYDFETEDYSHFSSMGCQTPRSAREEGKKVKEATISFENRRFLGHTWRTPKGQVIKF